MSALVPLLWLLALPPPCQLDAPPTRVEVLRAPQDVSPSPAPSPVASPPPPVPGALAAAPPVATASAAAARAVATATLAATSTTPVGADALDDGSDEVAEGTDEDDEIRLEELIGVAPPPEEKANEVVPVDTQPVTLSDLVDVGEGLEIGKAEVMRDAWIDRSSERDLLDELDAIERAAPVWPEPGDLGWDIPLSNDERVAMWINYYQGAGRERFRVWLSRLTRVAPIFWPVLEAEGLPRDTIFLAMIESGFSARATSWASAAGPWQFMPDTGRHFGLEVGFWVDERRDYEASTHAAAAYLKQLHGEFGDWMLAWAAYNTGEGRIRRAVRRLGTKDFWTISRTRVLYRETKHYVPKLIAAALVAKQPEAYGIEPPEYLPPVVWDTVTVTTAVDLATLARACGRAVQVADLEALNPALYRGVTPPRREWTVRVPKGARLSCALGLSSIPPMERTTYRFHRVRRGDTVESIAKLYSTTPKAILDFNRLTQPRIDAFEALVVPLPLALDTTIPVAQDEPRWLRNPPFTPLSGAAVRVHRVRSGDSLWKIARQYGVNLQSLRAWNGLGRNARLRVGQHIRIGR